MKGEIEIRQYGKIRDVEPTFGADDFVVGMAEIRRMVALGEGLRRLQDLRDGRWARLVRGVRVLLKANRERNEHGERLHQLVRAIEGLIKPRIGRSADDFAHRGQTFAIASHAARETLEQLFDLRSHVEHLNSPLDVLAGQMADRIALVNRRTRQADALARFALRRVVEEDPLLSVFETDDSIDRFWALPDGDRVKVWGKRLDINAID